MCMATVRYIPNASFWLTAICIDHVDISQISFPPLTHQNAHNILEPCKYTFYSFNYFGSVKARNWYLPLTCVSCVSFLQSYRETMLRGRPVQVETWDKTWLHSPCACRGILIFQSSLSTPPCGAISIDKISRNRDCVKLGYVQSGMNVLLAVTHHDTSCVIYAGIIPCAARGELLHCHLESAQWSQSARSSTSNLFMFFH